MTHPAADQYLILGSTIMLLVLGLVMVLSASSVYAYTTAGSTFALFAKQLLWAGLGLGLFFLVARTPLSWWRRMAYPMLGLTLFALVLVLVPGIGVEVNGNRNWLDIGGPFRVQPSEATKLVLIVWGASVLATKHALLGQWRHLLVPVLPVSAIALVLVLVGGDLGTALVIMAVVGALYFIAGAPWRLFALLGGIAVAGVVALSVTTPYRLERFSTWLNPEADYLGSGWQAVHSKFALATGGWWGVGLGASREKWGGLPEAHTDFIFAIVGEELGLVGTLTVLLLFAGLILAGIRIALRATDRFVRLTAAGITFWIAFQAVVNIGAVLGLLPITGVPLPLVSYGGSALLPTLAGLGLLLALSRHPSADRVIDVR